MSHYEAVFEIKSKSDAEAIRRLAERIYDALREETREIYGDEDKSTEILETFEAIRDATRHPTPGTLTIHYHQHDETFED
ncbi:hypothetical protein [Haladaptatus caseinilyticus]|uniref:hypothetical protein n=1 Tax=Haladaptatus caseinilyticus TaxID=2993314 RepID=UPI00224AAC7D|nr:hypothetical protein [Haladaptatus caseinilyticus]